MFLGEGIESGDGITESASRADVLPRQGSQARCNYHIGLAIGIVFWADIGYANSVVGPEEKKGGGGCK